MTRHLSLLIALLMAAPVAAEEDAARGAAAFAAHCAACHGKGATGNGPMTAVLSVAPPDLTVLTRNEGSFPAARIVQRVDGRTEVLAHGGPMPLFGLILEGPSRVIVGPDGTEVVTSETMAQIAAWLGTVPR